ncbi:serpin-Z10-like [Humulus lupulus]|uniref:serpin-Z10-like n=1 Tax=Humulus lupulus TaxID=3486 RepID=UPI002B411B2E|nr:serpin-Z10-like [Humulus lupulus]
MVEKFNSNTKLLSLECVNPHMRVVKPSRMSIPKLKFSYDVDAKKLLEERGLTLPFSNMDGDLSNMVDYDNVIVNDDNVYISLMVHKSCIEVNEKGTKVLAATVVAMVTDGARSRKRPPSLHAFVVVVDPPFVFTIVEEFSKLIAFSGAILHLQK